MLFISRRIDGSLIPIVPPSPMTSSMTPWRPRKKAKVTTKLGIRSLATSRPIITPMMTPLAMEASTARYHGQLCSVTVTPSTAALVPAANPTDRSISPSSRTNTSPIAMTMTPALWLIRFAKLNVVGNVERRINEKRITKVTSPSTAGSAPTSPPRIRAQ